MWRRYLLAGCIAFLALAVLPVRAQSEPLVIETVFKSPRAEFSPDSSLLAIYDDAGVATAFEVAPTPDHTAIRLIDAATGEARHTLLGARDFVAALIFAPDGTQLYTLLANGDLITWDVASGNLVNLVRTPLLSTRTPLFWHPQTGELVAAVQNFTHTSYTTLDPVTGAMRLLTHNVSMPTYNQYRQLQDERGSAVWSDTVVVPMPRSEALSSLPLVGDEVWTANPQGQVALLSLGSGARQVLRPGDDMPMFAIYDLVVTPSGTLGFTVENEDTLYLFNLTNGEETDIPIEHSSALLSPDGEQIAQYNADGVALLLSPVEGGKAQTLALPEGLTAGPLRWMRLRYSPDGAHLAAMGLQDANEQGVIVVYDL